MQSIGAFKVGDFIAIKSASRPGKDLARIIRFRDAVGNRRPGRTLIGADLLFEDGTVGFHFLHDITRWNPDRVKATFEGARQ